MGTTGKQKKKIRPVGDTLDAVFDKQSWGNQVHLFSLVRRWPEVAGKDIASNSMPAFFRRDVLWVYVQSSIWMQQMHLVKLELLDTVNLFLKGSPVVTDLRWMMQPAGLIDPALVDYISPPPQVDAAAEKEFRMMAENIADPATREAFCNMWLRMTTKNNLDQKTSEI